MTFLEAILAGTIQGLTEFLPISSSGHLVLVHKIFGFSDPNMFFDIFLHLATVVAVVVFLRSEIYSLFKNREYKMFFYIFIATIPAVGAGLIFGGQIEQLFQNATFVACMLIITGILLIFGHLKLKNDPGTKKTTLFSAIIMGVFQMFALLPGISRSGSTVTAGLLSGMKKENAYKLSFLMAIPIICGTAVFEIMNSEYRVFQNDALFVYAAGMIAAFFVGLFSLKLFWLVLKKERLLYLSLYCVILGGTVLLFWK